MKTRAWQVRLLCFLATLVTGALAVAQNELWVPDVASLKGYKDEYHGFMLPTIFPFIIRHLRAEAPRYACFSPDGDSVLLATPGWEIAKGFMGDRTTKIPDSTLYAWSVRDGKIRLRLHASSPCIRAGYEFSADGQHIISAHKDGTVRLWDAKDGHLIRRIKNCKGDPPAETVSISGDGRRVTVCGRRIPVRVWDLTSGELLREIPKDKLIDSTVAILSRDGGLVLWGRVDGTVKMADVGTGKVVRSFGIPVSSGRHVGAIQLSGQDRRLFVATRRIVTEYDVETGTVLRKMMHPLSSDYESIDGIQVSSDGKLLLAWGTNKKLFLWNVETGETVGEPAVQHCAVLGAAFVQDGKRILAFQGNSWDVYGWNVPVLRSPTRPKPQILMDRHIDALVPTAVAFSPDGQFLAVATHDAGKGTLLFFSTDKWELVKEFASVADAFKQKLVFSPNSKELIVFNDSQASLRDVQTGSYLPIPLRPPVSLAWEEYSNGQHRTIGTYARIRSVQAVFYLSGDVPVFLACGPNDPLPHPWNLRTLTSVYPYALDFGETASVTPDHKQMIVWPREGDFLSLRDFATNQEISRFPCSVTRVLAVSPDSSRVFVGQSYGTYVLCELPQFKEIASFKIERERISGPCIMLDSQHALAVHHDLQIRLWNLAEGKELQSFPLHETRIEQLVVSPDNRMAASTDSSGSLVVWNIPPFGGNTTTTTSGAGP